MLNYTTIASFITHFEDPKDTPAPETAAKVESAEQRKATKRAAKEEKRAAELEALLEKYDPSADPKLVETDPYKTLFVARISYDTPERKLRKESPRQRSGSAALLLGAV